MGMMLMATAGDLIVIFSRSRDDVDNRSNGSIGRKSRARDPKSNEAAMKYFLLGAFSTGFSAVRHPRWFYGATGSNSS